MCFRWDRELHSSDALALACREGLCICNLMQQHHLYICVHGVSIYAYILLLQEEQHEGDPEEISFTLDPETFSFLDFGESDQAVYFKYSFVLYHALCRSPKETLRRMLTTASSRLTSPRSSRRRAAYRISEIIKSLSCNI